MTWWDGGIEQVPFAGAAPTPNAGIYINNTDADIYDHYVVGWSTPAVTRTDITVGNGSEYFRSFSIGGRIHYVYALTFGTTTTVGLLPTVTSTVPASERGYLIPGVVAAYDDSNTRWHPVAAFGSSLELLTFNVSSTAPFTWTTGDILSAMWTFRKAPEATSVGY